MKVVMVKDLSDYFGKKDDGHIVVDVRREDEYASGHIPGAICIPNETIYKDQPEELPDLDQGNVLNMEGGAI